MRDELSLTVGDILNVNVYDENILETKFIKYSVTDIKDINTENIIIQALNINSKKLLSYPSKCMSFLEDSIDNFLSSIIDDASIESMVDTNYSGKINALVPMNSTYLDPISVIKKEHGLCIFYDYEGAEFNGKSIDTLFDGDAIGRVEYGNSRADFQINNLKGFKEYDFFEEYFEKSIVKFDVDNGFSIDGDSNFTYNQFAVKELSLIHISEPTRPY